ncbi:ATP-binding protein [Shewanella sp. CG12_big_fil_rev_8_21_14_0_65_47_15]|uniref:AAA family ATPase n=1 Tax=Shewanella sp. CG12_big_fil_rev_8_21_14_0_65_47_15 TaxID=1975537 RepID=UPI0025E4AE85|nr:ATP-binding protein [Shewanella sp. CG12_big_fil_rev_8_21_14_0_65_47_15]
MSAQTNVEVTVSDMGSLVFVCGKMGAGKSTLSRQLAEAENCILISEDEWLAALYPDEINDFDAYLSYSARLKPLLKKHVQELLCSGVSVVMDFPANTVNQRLWFRSIFTDSGAAHKLIYLNHSDALCLSQLDKRRQSHPERAMFDTEAMFWHVSGYFQPPTMAEGFDLEVIES